MNSGRRTQATVMPELSVAPEELPGTGLLMIDGEEYDLTDLPPRLVAILASYPELTKKWVVAEQGSNTADASFLAPFGWDDDWADWDADWNDSIVKNILYKGVQDVLEPMGSSECPQPLAYPTTAAVLCDDEPDP